MLSDRDRTRLLLDAPKEQLSKIDQILLGKNKEENIGVQKELCLKTYSISDAAKELNICRKSVYKLIHEGALKPIKLGNRSRISNLSIMEYLKMK